MQALRIVTLNTWKCDGRYAQRLPLISEGLRALRPDIVLLQEAFATLDGRLDTAAGLAGSLGLQHEFLPARRKWRSVDGVSCDSLSGLAVLAPGFRNRADWLRLPEDPRDGERWALSVRCQTRCGELRVVNTHLTHLHDAEALRLHQLRRIVQLAATNGGRGPAILGGDLNTGPNGPALAWLESQTVCPAVSAWRDAGAGGCPGTLNLGDTSTCIDHLYRLGVGPDSARWRAVATAMTAASDSDVLASDHAAVIGWLELDVLSPVADGALKTGQRIPDGQ